MSMKMHDMIDALQEETSNGKTFVYLTKRNETLRNKANQFRKGN
jgi:hypothetical protein